MTETVPVEADFERAPMLLDGAASIELTAKGCDLGYWFTSVAQGTLQGRPLGYSAGAVTPEYMREPGPLGDALRLELAYRTLDEECATKVLSYYVAIAPDVTEMEFFATQMMDECRHHMVFRNHLLRLGIPADGLMAWVRRTGAAYRKDVLEPVVDFATAVVRDERDFIGAVLVFTIICEGALAAACELSERKWTPVDPAFGEIAHSAGIDEIRHLTVGSSVVREHLLAHPQERGHVIDVLRRGRIMWDEVKGEKFVMEREELFQQGIEQHRDLFRDVELYPGCLLLDTTPRQRYELAEEWNQELSNQRLEYMGIPEAIELLRGNVARIL